MPSCSLCTSVTSGAETGTTTTCHLNCQEWFYMDSLLRIINTIPNPPEKFRKQVIKTFSTREGWWYIGIKGDGGAKSKGTRLLIEKEK